MKPVQKPLKVGTVARRLGVSAAMIRSWEALGLTTPARSQSRYRLYTEDDLRVLRRAVHLRKAKRLNTPAILMQLNQEGMLKDRAGCRLEKESSPSHILRRLRLQRGISLSTVAQAIGVSKGFLSNLERSRCHASIKVLADLARYYRVAGFTPAEPFPTRGPLLTARDRKTLRGYLNPGKLGGTQSLDLLTPEGEHREFTVEDVRSIYFVRAFTDDFESERKTFLSRPKLDGLWVRLKFRDGDTIEVFEG